MSVKVTRMWLEEEINYADGKFYRPGGVHGAVLTPEFVLEAEEDEGLYHMLTKVLLKPLNPLIKRHLHALSGVPLDLKDQVPVRTQLRVGLYHGHLINRTPLPDPTLIRDVSEMYIARVLPLYFMPSQELERWVDGTLEDELRADPKYERQLENRMLQAVEALVFKRIVSTGDDGDGTEVVSEVYEAEVFESRLMEQFPDYFSVLVDLNWSTADIPLSPFMLPDHLLQAYERASLRIELKMKAGCFSSKRREDIKYALDVMDKKYKDKAQPFFQPATNSAEALPSWLSDEVLSALEERFQDGSRQSNGEVRPPALPSKGETPVKLPRKKVVESEKLE